MKHTSYFSSLLFYILTLPASEEYIISELNLRNYEDIYSTCEIFDDNTTAANCVVPSKKTIERYFYTESIIPQCFRVQKNFVCKNNDNKACGIVIVRPDQNENIATITLLAVHPNHRRKNIASTLLHAAEIYSSQLSISRLVLTVHHHNAQARACYEKNGFTPELLTKLKADFCAKALTCFPCCSYPQNEIAFGMTKNVSRDLTKDF
jgi:ribosomal protein S18 acetylase RimI-like enzyme